MIFFFIQVDIEILKTVCGQILRFKNVILPIFIKMNENTANVVFETKKCDFRFKN